MCQDLLLILLRLHTLRDKLLRIHLGQIHHTHLCSMIQQNNSQDQGNTTGIRRLRIRMEVMLFRNTDHLAGLSSVSQAADLITMTTGEVWRSQVLGSTLSNLQSH